MSRTPTAVALVFCFLALGGSGTGCASAMKKAGKLLEAGAFEEAIGAYEAILAEDPKKPEALEGLRVARRGFLDSKLLAARFSRLAGRTLEGAETLLLVSSRQAAWGMGLASAALTSWEDETEAQSVALHAEMRQALQERKLVRAEWIAKHFAPLFTKKGTVAIRAAKSEVASEGRKFCSESLSKVRDGFPYHAEHVARLCRLWGVSVPAEKSPESNGLVRALQDHFSRLSPALDFRSRDQAVTEQVRQELQRGFQESPWYDPRSDKVWSVRVAGRWSSSVEHQEESRTHHYSERENYTVQEDVRQADGSVLRQTVTKVREVPRSYEYWGTRYVEDFHFDLGVSTVDGVQVSAAYSQRHRASGFFHSEWKPEIGLSPVRESLTAPEPWLRQQLDTWSARWVAELRSQWRARFCLPALTGEGADPHVAATHQVFRCLKDKLAVTEPMVRTWHERELGLTPEQAAEVLL
jgi:hypothetical protein